MAVIFPSLISADLLRLGKEINILDPHVAGFHIDVMDFHFVPNLTSGFSFIEAIRNATDKQLHIHIMVDQPGLYIDRLALRQGDIVSVHWESVPAAELAEILEAITARGWIASIALNPETDIRVLERFPQLQHVLLMTVHPGFSGQTIIPEMFQKLTNLSEYKKERNRAFTIAVDGGITAENCGELVRRGAEQLAIASAIFQNPNRIEAITTLLERMKL